MLNNEIAETIISLGIQKEKIYADCAERKSIDEIKLHGINIEPTLKGPDSVINGIQFINQFDIVIDERCFKTIEEFENYTWKKDKKSGEYINEPVDTYNHTIDAIRYGLNKKIASRGLSKVNPLTERDIYKQKQYNDTKNTIAGTLTDYELRDLINF